MKKVESITAFVTVDREGSESLMAFTAPGGLVMQMVCIDESGVEDLRAMAEKLRQQLGVQYRVLRFSKRQELEER